MFFFLCLQSFDVTKYIIPNSMTGETEIKPAFQSQQSNKHMPSNFDFVAYMR